MIYRRADWGSTHRATQRIAGPVDTVFVHHLGSPVVGSERETVKSVEEFHVKARGMQAIAYSWLVGKNGDRYEGRGWGIVGGHTAGWNSKAYAVCALGNFDNDKATRPLIEAVAATIREGMNLGYVRHTAAIRAHRDVGTTACPGDHLYAAMPEIRALVGQDEEDDDMTPDQARMLAELHDHITKPDLATEPDHPPLMLRWAVSEALLILRRIAAKLGA